MLPLMAAALIQSAVIDCAYPSKADDELRQRHACGHIDRRSRLVLSTRHLAALRFNRCGSAQVWANGGWYYVARRGRSAPVMTMDNGPDPFADGLARSEVGGKVGFIDTRLRLVIARRFDGALPFEHGRAKVCLGCKVESDGEHSRYIGGRWFSIDRRGRLSPDRP